MASAPATGRARTRSPVPTLRGRFRTTAQVVAFGCLREGASRPAPAPNFSTLHTGRFGCTAPPRAIAESLTSASCLLQRHSALATASRARSLPQTRGAVPGALLAAGSRRPALRGVSSFAISRRSSHAAPRVLVLCITIALSAGLGYALAAGACQSRDTLDFG